MTRFKKPCGNASCGVSTFRDGKTVSFGSGKLGSDGRWERPCRLCAEAWKRDFPLSEVWPVEPGGKP